MTYELGVSSKDLHREGYAYLTVTVMIVAYGWVGYGWQAGIVAACATVPAFFGVLYVTRRETRRLRTALEHAEDELDDYDALRVLIKPLVYAPPRSTVERAAARAIRTAWSQ